MDHEPSRWMTRLAQACVRRPAWVLVAVLGFVGLVNLVVPQLEHVVATDSTPIAPKQAPAIRALAAMDHTFGNGRSVGIAFVVLERDGGLTSADQAYLTALIARLRADSTDVSYVQDVTSSPEILDAVTSKDKAAVYLQIGVPGAIGAPSALSQIRGVRDLTDVNRPAGLRAEVTGPAATIADMSIEVNHSILTITFVTVGLIAIILFLIYRSIVVTGVILGFIGIALAGARGTVALLGGHLFAVSTFTVSFLTAVVLGAATDYAIFMISRFQEQRRLGTPVREAAVFASSRVSAVIIGSALTVVVANACMALAKVGVYLTTGPAIALGIVVTLGLSLTWLPAILTVVGSRGWLDPRPRTTGPTGWERLAALVVARPVRVLMAGLLPLLILASFYPLMKPSFDEGSVQPDHTPSNRGLALISAHFPVNEILPDYILVSADHDMRDAGDLAALEQMSAAVARVPGVISVRGVTRPLGTTITQASLGYQAGQVGGRLSGADEKLRAGETGARDLVAGASKLNVGAGQAADGAGRLLTGVQALQAGVVRLAAANGTAVTGSTQLRDGATQLAAGLSTAYDQTSVAVDGLGQAYAALTSSLTCGIDPYCSGARAGIKRIYEGERDQLLPGLARARDAARRIANGSVELHDGLAQIDAGLAQARTGVNQLADGSQSMKDHLGQLADGTQQVAGGTQTMSQSVTELRSGLAQAAAYLTATGKAAKDPAISGFYLPPTALKDPRFALASGLFLSPDGRTARMIVLGDTGAYDRAATERAAQVRTAAQTALHGTPLADSDVQTTGMATINADLESYNSRDFTLIAIVALIGVFLILLTLLRSVVAAGFLLASVVLSYSAAMGLGVLVWQILFDQPLDWSVATIAFILLVAVGADYNLLLMKRMLDEAPDGSKSGIARAVAATGGVITAAGIIFAASLFAMMSGSVLTLAEIGFTIGIGLLLDTFVVRTLVVPAGATLLGARLWWPRRARVSSADDRPR